MSGADVDVVGLVYRVHRGPGRRIVQAWTDSQGAWQGRFVLDDAIWAVPVPPQPEPVDCLWCASGPADTLRLAGSGPVEGISRSEWRVRPWLQARDRHPARPR